MSGALVLAHGIGGRSDLPLPLWLFSYGAGAALLISFVALRILWTRSRLDAAAAGRPAPTWASRAVATATPAARALGLAVFVVVLVASVVAPDNAAANLAPVAVYVLFWVGLQAASALVGNLWSVLSPWDTVAAVAARLRTGRPRRAMPATAQKRDDATHWPAVAGLAAFVWLELCYHDPASPRVLALALGGYALVMLAAAARLGRGWLRTGDAFAAWFGLLAAMAPLTRDGEGRLRLRWPFAGLAAVTPRPGTTALVMVVLGSTAFDGVTRTSMWADITGARTGWSASLVATVGLAWVVGIVALAYTGAMRLAARRTDREPGSLVTPFLHSLVPIALAYAVAHYFSLFVFEGQQAIALASDPFALGWDLFGTTDRGIDFRALSSASVAYVQAGAIVVGHVVGVVVAHDRAVATLDPRNANRSQEPLLVVMVAYTVGGLGLLLGS